VIQLGAGPLADFSDPLAMLSDCHRRVERFLDGLLAVAEQARGGELTANQREALDLGLRYFGGMGAKHNADEEESLFPRLRAAIEAADDAAGRALLQGLAHLEADHDEADACLAEVRQIGQRWLAEGRLETVAADRFAALLGRLRETYREHIRYEDEVVFPSAAKLVSAAELALVGQEMAARRGSLTCSQRKALAGD